VGPASLRQWARPVDLTADLPVAPWAVLRAVLRAVLPVALRGLPTHRQTVPRRQRRLRPAVQARPLLRLLTPLQSSPWWSSSLPSWWSSSLPRSPGQQASHQSDAGQPAARWWMRRSGRIRPSPAVSQGLPCSRLRALERAHRPEPWTRFSCLGPGVTRTTRSNAASSCSRAHWVFISEPLLRGRRQRCCQRRNLQPRLEDLGTHLRDVDTRAGKGP